jgi:single-strand DNA-binding protein
MNSVTLTGKLYNFETSNTTNGDVSKFSLLVDNMYKSKKTTFVEVESWDLPEKQVDSLSQMQKGQGKIIVTGRLQQDTWEDKKTGGKRSKLKVVANNIAFLYPKEVSEKTQEENSNVPF